MTGRVGIGNRLIEVKSEVEVEPTPNAEHLLVLIAERGRLEREAQIRPSAQAIAAVIAARRFELAAATPASSTSPGLVRPGRVPRNDRPYSWQALPEKRR